MAGRHESEKPERLKDLACNTVFPGRNLLLHQFVLENSPPAGENFISFVLSSMADAPGRTVNAWNDDGYTPLHLAILKRNFLMVGKLLLLLANIDVDKTCGYGCVREGARYRYNTPLHLATKLNDLSIMQKLCDKPAGVDIANGHRRTALYIAAKHGRLDAMKLLVTRGADVNANCGRITPLAVAALHGKLDAVKYLVMRNAHFNFSGYNRPLLCAIRSGNVAIVEFLINKGAAVNIAEDGRDTPLHEAARRSSTGVVECLLRSGANVNARGNLGRTPLHEEADNRRSENAKLLLDAGSEVNANDVYNNTPLHYAVRNGKLGLVNIFLERGAYVNARDKHYETPLHLAVKERNKFIERFLSCSFKREQDRAVKQGTLKIARQNEVIRALLDKGADVSARDVNGQTPLDLARNQKSIDALRDIIQEGSATDDVLPAKRMKT